jgi:hypothetical protein
MSLLRELTDSGQTNSSGCFPRKRHNLICVSRKTCEKSVSTSVSHQTTPFIQSVYHGEDVSLHRAHPIDPFCWS